MLFAKRLLPLMVSFESVPSRSLLMLILVIGLYNAFLAPGSPCELNIDHALRNSLASRMTKAVGDDESMFKSLQEVVNLFEMAQTSVFKLMSSVSKSHAHSPCVSVLTPRRIPSRSFCVIPSMPSFSRNTKST